MANANLLKRLVTLETKNIKVMPLCIIYQADDGLTDEQQAQVDKADSEKQPVLLIRITSVENKVFDE